MVKKQQISRPTGTTAPSRSPNPRRGTVPHPVFQSRPYSLNSLPPCEATAVSAALQSFALQSPAHIRRVLVANGIQEVAIGRGTIYTREGLELRTERRDWMVACIMQGNKQRRTDSL